MNFIKISHEIFRTLNKNTLKYIYIYFFQWRRQKPNKVKNYLLVELVGGGQFGKVYKTLNLETKEILACKVVPRTALDRTKIKELFI